ncbi:MAG: hypothetical protein EOM45_06665 [Clostridia bacterium]|nr:hypothetical protein [Clostridia bacterium]
MQQVNNLLPNTFASPMSRKWMLAEQTAERLENEDELDRIILEKDNDFTFLTLDECYEVFSEYDGQKVEKEHIEEAFYHSPDGLPVDMFYDYILSVKLGSAEYFIRALTMVKGKYFYMMDVEEQMDDDLYSVLQIKLGSCSDMLFLTCYLQEHEVKFARPFIFE